MTHEKISDALDTLDERFIAEAVLLSSRANQRKEVAEMSNRRKFHMSRAGMVAIAACIALMLGAVCYAAGWPSLFQQMKDQTTQDMQKLYESAIEANEGKEPEVIDVDSPDFSALTVMESYYDGESLLLGIDISSVTPAPVIGYEPEEAIITEMKSIPGNYAFITGDDTLAQEEEQEWLENRTDHAKEADLRSMSAIIMDHQLKEKLSEDEYEQFWTLLGENGHACVVFQSVTPSDHVLLADGGDCGNASWTELSDGWTLSISPLTDEAQNLDSLDLQLKLYTYQEYWYMELDGSAYIAYERDEGTQVPVLVTSANA